MERITRDVRLAFKALKRRPMFAAVVIGTLALGVGAATSVFSVVNAVLLSGLPHAHADELVMFRLNAGEVSDFPAVSTGELALFQDESRSLSQVAGAGAPFTAYAVIQGETVPIETAIVSAEMFAMLGVHPVAGRLFTPDDERIPFGQNGTTVISYELWQRRFAGDPGIIGTPLRGEGGPTAPAPAIIGVLPPGFRLEMGPLSRLSGGVDSWIANRVPPDWSNRFLRVIGRLAPGVPLADAQQEIDVMMTRVIQDHPEADADGPNPRFDLVPLHEDIVADVRPAILILFGAVGLVFLVACGNAASMLLARTSMRQGEFAVHNALGAGRGQIVRLVLTESFLLAGAAGVLGAGIANFGIQGLLGVDPGTIPLVDRVRLDPVVLLFAVGLSLLATILFGLLPSIFASTPKAMSDNLRHGARVGGGLGTRARRSLVVFQVAFSIVLLTATGLLVRTFINLRATDLGYQPDNVVTFRARIDGTRYPFNDPTARFEVYRRLVDRLRLIPGVSAAGGVSTIPLDGRNQLLSYRADGQVGDANADFRWVLPGYFETMRIPLLAGREITAQDNDGSRPVAMVDQLLADRTWPGEDPLGKWISWTNFNNQTRRFQVIGVVGHARIGSVDDVGRQQVYLPYSDVAFGAFSLVVRTERTVADVLPDLRQAAADAGTGRAIDLERPLSAYVADSTGSYRFALVLMGALGLVAIALTVVGVYGTVSYLVALRTKEMGIRVALGAPTRDVVFLNLREGLGVTLAGVVVGAIGVLGTGQFMESILYRVSRTDPPTFAIVALGVVALGLVASFVPARRASRIDPIRALREE